MTKPTQAEALATVEAFMAKSVRFHETGYEMRHDDDPENLMLVGVVVEGGFGVADEFFNALRVLGKVKMARGAWHRKR